MSESRNCTSQARPGPSLKRSCNGMPPLAYISFWASGALPLQSDQCKR